MEFLSSRSGAHEEGNDCTAEMLCYDAIESSREPSSNNAHRRIWQSVASASSGLHLKLIKQRQYLRQVSQACGPYADTGYLLLWPAEHQPNNVSCSGGPAKQQSTFPALPTLSFRLSATMCTFAQVMLKFEADDVMDKA